MSDLREDLAAEINSRGCGHIEDYDQAAVTEVLAKNDLCAARRADILIYGKMPPDDPCVWMIVFEEPCVRPEIFSGCGATEAAHRRFEQLRKSYNCSLFVRIAKG